MKLLFRLFVLSLIITSAFCGIKDFNKHFGTINPRENETHDMPNFPPEFHKENTITNDLIAEEEEEEDYLDWEKIFGDYDYGDIIDASPYPYPVSEIQQGNILELFHGKTRIQRLNILNANFGFNLYRSLKDRANSSDNILMAPVGISTAMAMISLGLKGQTHQEVLSVLGFRDFINASSKYEIMTIHNLFRKLTHRLFRRNFGYTLRSVNDLYIRKQFSIMDDFRNNTKNYYFAEAQSSDFSDPAFITKTNERILKRTKGLIKEALVNINPTTMMMILNCIYFKVGGISAAKLRTREVVLPKFKLEKSYDLTDYLKSMGIETLFGNNGDYSGISDEKVIIDMFNHQGTITVNEEGTEAAAVTTVGFMPLSTQIRFVVDRPFLFLIYEHRTSCLLFLGRVANPSKF
ncbi:Heparin cofactor 2 [Chelonia mydas]|uniref:Heparin cofactor 2 n=1 Tax=Chelonia mydas TaxID=8469 RepID=M7BQT8_CHEMY|nr:Heparin cofactor 2 [Chelonia mydas]